MPRLMPSKNLPAPYQPDTDCCTEFLHMSRGEMASHGSCRFNGRFLASERGSANHLIRQEEQRWRHRDRQGLGGLEVEDQLEFHGLFHLQLGGLGPF